MPLSVDETAVVSRLWNQLTTCSAADKLHDAYFEGSARLKRLGLAVPPDLAMFETIVDWPRLVVEAIEERCDVKSFIRGGEVKSSDELREIYDANNLDSEFHLTRIDSLVYGRGFLSIGTNEDDRELPLITVESPAEMTVEVDHRHRRVKAALKVYGYDANGVGPTLATLYMPNRTTWLERRKSDGRWEVVDVDAHNVGRVMVLPFLNRRRSGRWLGVSELTSAISLTDAACRNLTNLQVAQETHAVPSRWAVGMSKGDFVDKAGEPLPVWQAYFTAIMATQNESAKFGQFSASDLRNFHETTNHYAMLLSGQYGLPMRYLGQNTANPPSADGIRADEARLVKRAERKMSAWGDQLARAMAYALRIRDGEWPEAADRIQTVWHDAATPTYAARVDGVMKMAGGPILSREGGWDELGWTEARKKQEREYFAAQESDPVLERLTREVVDVSAQVGG